MEREKTETLRGYCVRNDISPWDGDPEYWVPILDESVIEVQKILDGHGTWKADRVFTENGVVENHIAGSDIYTREDWNSIQELRAAR